MDVQLLRDLSKIMGAAHSPLFTGVSGSYLRGSIENAGLDPGTIMVVSFFMTSSIFATRAKPLIRALTV